jgi:small-conductance mechanosensitive channel
VKFQVGDRVQVGVRVGTITDVGTLLIQVKSDEGRLRVVCPWELVKILGRHDRSDGRLLV